jgi:ubiquinone biosynthesis monooxygenase Coq7
MTASATTGTRKARPPAPGTSARDDVHAIIRVDHAGEFGAQQIYAGQLAVLSRDPQARETVAAIKRMAAQEDEHFAIFERLVNEREVRPTALEPLWRVAGYALGAVTALMGEKAAMACTVAVEEVIDEHYAAQAERLGDSDPELKSVIEKARAEELEHRDKALASGAEEAPAYSLLSAAIKLGCRTAIALAERI